ncbi:MAG: hypothetical protein HY744_21365 [Deltaproteobacteria bacterium]|nr:hypothetical protein [Deltaproteobacteria bacterium]
MVLSDRYGGTKPRPGLLKRTIAYVVGFALGALLIAVGLSLAAVAIAQALLPGPPTAASAPLRPGLGAGERPGEPSDEPTTAAPPARGSKAAARRANDASEPSGEELP